jgi:hypothetical protein
VAATVFDGKGKHHVFVCDVASGATLYTAEVWAGSYSPDGRRFA